MTTNKNPLSWDNKFIYSNKTKVAEINKNNNTIRLLGWFSSDIIFYIKDIASYLKLSLQQN